MTTENYKNRNIQYAIEIISKNLPNLISNNNNEFISNISIACILDEFSYECLKYEAPFFQLGTKNWKEIMENKRPQLLFVESAWMGYNYEWINGISNIQLSKTKTLLSILDYCKNKKIPTVFWAKEDPYDFDIFIEAAKHFDYVFTTDLDSIPKYKKILNHNNIYLLPFAAQLKIHNPINKDKEKIGKVAFAGGWYKKFPDRCKQMESLLKPAFKYNLAIYNRFAKVDDSNFAFPKEYTSYLKNPLDYNDMVKEYKKYEIFLNVNSTDTSPTTFARRVFELLACGIPIISSYSLGIENLFKDIVMLSKDVKDTEKYLSILVNNKELRDRLSLLGLREVINNHTYSNRLHTVLNTIGLDVNRNSIKGVSVITCTNRLFSLDNILENYLSQKYPLKELIIIINNDSIDFENWTNNLKDHDDIRVYKLPENYSLGECLNFGVEKSKYNYISKFDDDDYYGPDYLTDSINTFKYTNAHIVGKYSIYAYFEDTNTLALRYPNRENRYMDYVAGSTLTMKKEIFNKIKFHDVSKSEDTLFLEDCLKEGYKIYASDRFNHVVIRRKDLSTHSWKITEREFLKKSILIDRTKNFKPKVTV